MYNNVVSEVFNNFINNNISCLRFNFRAVGRSTGKHSSGRGELSDAKTFIDFLINEKKIEKIFICGYSYGAAIGCSVVNYSNVLIGYVAISFPWDFMGLKYRKLSQTDKPKLFIQGNKDEIARYEKFQEHYNFYDDPKDFKIIQGADHFYLGHEHSVADEVFKFYRSIV
jgi:alpha/beta superfamily hydrolase